MRGTEGYLQTQCQCTNTPTLMLHRKHPLTVPDLPPSLLLTEAEEQCTGTVMKHNPRVHPYNSKLAGVMTTLPAELHLLVLWNLPEESDSPGNIP